MPDRWDKRRVRHTWLRERPELALAQLQQSNLHQDDKNDFPKFEHMLLTQKLNLDALKVKAGATPHAELTCTVMLSVAKTATDIGKPDLTRSVKCV